MAPRQHGDARQHAAGRLGHRQVVSDGVHPIGLG